VGWVCNLASDTLIVKNGGRGPDDLQVEYRFVRTNNALWRVRCAERFCWSGKSVQKDPAVGTP
jgi:hypothetical protein